MAILDLNHWAIIGYKDETGLGRMCQDLRALMPMMRFLVVPSRRIQGNPLEPGERLLDPELPESDLERLLQGLQGIIFFEHSPHPALLEVAGKMGTATVAVPMWEWFKSYDEAWKKCTHFICPNHFAQQILGKAGYRNTTVIPWAIDLKKLPVRSIQGPARLFVHNAGMYEPDDRKATRDTIAAFKEVKDPNLRLLVRVQNGLDFPVDDPRIEVRQGNLAEHRDLYSEGDVIIQTSKAEGLGFGILEALGSGMPVITTNYPPMNEAVTERSMLVQPRWGKYPCHQTSYIPQAHFKLPRPRDFIRKLRWCASHDLSAISKANRAWAEEVFNPVGLSEQWISTLAKCLVK